MAAPTNAALVKKVLANTEPSTHGPFRPRLSRVVVSVIGGVAAARLIARRGSQ
jgi:hypothetical protein